MATETLTPRKLGSLTVQHVQERDEYLNMLIYGDSGVGKTTLAGSADAVPQMRPVLFVDLEGGTESLRHTYPNVDQVRIKSWKEMEILYTELLRGKHDYQTVVMDSLTEVQKFNMYEIMRQLSISRPDLDPDIPSMREWGKNLEQIRKLVRLFRDLPIHTIFTALAVTEKDDKTGSLLRRPQLSGKMGNEVAAFLDIVGYYFVKEVTTTANEKEQVRILLTQKIESAVAKDRTGRLPQTIRDPSMQELYSTIFSKVTTTKGN